MPALVASARLAPPASRNASAAASAAAWMSFLCIATAGGTAEHSMPGRRSQKGKVLFQYLSAPPSPGQVLRARMLSRALSSLQEVGMPCAHIHSFSSSKRTPLSHLPTRSFTARA